MEPTRLPENAVEWYRPVLLGRMVTVWLGGVMLIGLGLVLGGVGFRSGTQIPALVQGLAALGGVLSTISGALVALLGMLRLLSADPIWLLVRLDGLVYHTDQEEVFVPWQGLTGARSEPPGLVLEREGGAPLLIPHRFMGTTGPELAARLLELQRQALMGVLRQRTQNPSRYSRA